MPGGLTVGLYSDEFAHEIYQIAVRALTELAGEVGEDDTTAAIEAVHEAAEQAEQEASDFLLS